MTPINYDICFWMALGSLISRLIVTIPMHITAHKLFPDQLIKYYFGVCVGFLVHSWIVFLLALALQWSWNASIALLNLL